MQAPSTPFTIKTKLLQAIEGGEQDPNVLGHLFGLNGHDLVKNLEQLRKEGHIAFKWGAGDRVQRVWIPKGRQNMELLAGHTGEDATLRGDSQIRLGNAINRLPWNGEWRTYDHDALKRNSGLSSSQIASTMKALRENSRLQQLGGGTRGVPIKGVRWRGERSPQAVLATIQAEPATNGAETAPEPSGDRWPMARAAVKRWKKMILAAELLKQTGQEELAERLGETEEWKVMSYLGHELEGLLKEVGEIDDSASA